MAMRAPPHWIFGRVDEDQLALLSRPRVKEVQLLMKIRLRIIIGDDELSILGALFMGQGIAAPEGQLVEIPVELPEEGTVIGGEHDIPPAGAGFLPQPDVELALEADPVASLRLNIRGVAVNQGVLII